MLSPNQLAAVVTTVVGNVEIDALQVIMLGPDKAEVKARRTSDNQWFQGIVCVSDATAEAGDA
jgi:hypothetical protein